MLSNDPRLRRYRQLPPPETAVVRFLIPGRDPYVERLHLQQAPRIGGVVNYGGARWRIVRREQEAYVAELCFDPPEGGAETEAAVAPAAAAEPD
ncbi:MAG TPA: hypothetical protein VLW17_03870 [Thermoanaerobaculaceae bacterium]|nr:hypothetical protein [Thermoanaerobaculaceae bacterium]